MIELESSPLQMTDKKGVPGFSQRLNYLFDLAGAPSDTRLTWGAKRWNVVPNTVRNWIKLDTPPQNYSTLDFVVSDLLMMSNELIDKTAIIGWLYAGGSNPFKAKSLAKMPAIDHMTMIKIFNLAFSIGAKRGIDLNSMPEQKVNEMINVAYKHLIENSGHAKRGDITELCSSRTNPLKSDSYFGFFPYFFAKKSKNELTQKNHKGIPRRYDEAKLLHVIDEHVAELVDTMNGNPLIRTIASCEGHGWFFIKVPPYISFKTTIEVAGEIAKAVREDFYSEGGVLKYYWELNAYFDDNSSLTYVLSIPGISTGKLRRATRHGVDHDFVLISAMVNKILNHITSQEPKMKRQCNDACSSNANQHEN